MDKEYGSCNLWGDFYFRGFDLKKYVLYFEVLLYYCSRKELISICSIL